MNSILSYINVLFRYCDGWRLEEVGGVKLLVYRDAVVREAVFRHPTSAGFRGVHPEIVRGNDNRLWVFCRFKTGYLEGYVGFVELFINVDGRLMRWQGQLINYPKDKGQYYVARIPCDDEWLEHLRA